MHDLNVRTIVFLAAFAAFAAFALVPTGHALAETKRAAVPGQMETKSIADSACGACALARNYATFTDRPKVQRLPAEEIVNTGAGGGKTTGAADCKAGAGVDCRSAGSALDPVVK